VLAYAWWILFINLPTCTADRSQFAKYRMEDWSLLVTLYFVPTSFGDPLLPLLFSNYVSAYSRQEILGEL
jgi:hypothetical protein